MTSAPRYATSLGPRRHRSSVTTSCSRKNLRKSIFNLRCLIVLSGNGQRMENTRLHWHKDLSSTEGHHLSGPNTYGMRMHRQRSSSSSGLGSMAAFGLLIDGDAMDCSRMLPAPSAPRKTKPQIISGAHACSRTKCGTGFSIWWGCRT